MVKPFYDDEKQYTFVPNGLGDPDGNHINHCKFPKNLRRIATGYSELLRMRGHSYNIFEFAFLNAKMLNNSKHRSEAIGYIVSSVFTALLQFVVFGCLAYYSIGPDNDAVWEKWGEIQADREGHAAIMVIAVGTTLLFCKRAYMQFSEAREFNQVFTRLQMKATNMMLREDYLKFVGKKTLYCKVLCLWLNAFVNCGLALVVPVFNLFYLLLSETIDDAVLNSLALLFILELDEVVLPAWDDDRIEDELAINMLMYIGEEPKPRSDRQEELRVIKVRARALPHATCARPNEPPAPRAPRSSLLLSSAPEGPGAYARPKGPLTPHPQTFPVACPSQEGPGDYDSTDKLYVAINWTDVVPKTGDGRGGEPGDRKTPEEIGYPRDHHWGTVTVHRRVTEIKYEMTKYHIYGSKDEKDDGNDPCPAESFLTALEEVRVTVLLPICVRKSPLRLLLASWCLCSVLALCRCWCLSVLTLV